MVRITLVDADQALRAVPPYSKDGLSKCKCFSWVWVIYVCMYYTYATCYTHDCIPVIYDTLLLYKMNRFMHRCIVCYISISWLRHILTSVKTKLIHKNTVPFRPEHPYSLAFLIHLIMKCTCHLNIPSGALKGPAGFSAALAQPQEGRWHVGTEQGGHPRPLDKPHDALNHDFIFSVTKGAYLSHQKRC